jgi:two-component system chemotaxis response regulator CheY
VQLEIPKTAADLYLDGAGVVGARFQLEQSMKRRDARLLVIDDVPLSRVATHHALRALGCRRIDEAEQCPRALQLLSEQHYDLVISNWKMADMGGRELLHVIRHTPRTAGTPVVIATAVTAEVVAEASEAGVSAFLPRPFGFQTLEEVLRIFIGRPSPTDMGRSREQRTFVS